jgi:hypothetical protein
MMISFVVVIGAYVMRAPAGMMTQETKGSGLPCGLAKWGTAMTGGGVSRASVTK